MKRKSLYISIANPVSALIVYLALDLREYIPRWLEYIFYPFFLYFTLSVFISFGGIIIGALDFKNSDRRSMEIIGAVGNAIYFVGIMVFLKNIWPALMSV